MTQLLLKFEEYLLEKERSLKTIQAYITDMKQFYEYFNRDISQLSKIDILHYKIELNRKNLSIKTINRKLTCLNQYIKFLNEKCNFNILINVKNEKIQRQEYLEDMINKDDLNKLIQSAELNDDIRSRTIFNTLFYTGARVSEILQFRKSDVERDYISIKGKGSKYRDIFIPLKLKQEWLKYMRVRKDNSMLLFTGKRGAITPWTVHYLVKKYAKLSGVNLDKAKPHNLRHLYGITLAENGFTLDTIADLLGHSQIETTRIYTRKTRKQLLDAINKL